MLVIRLRPQSSGVVEIRSENPSFAPDFLDPRNPLDEFEVIGRVV